MYTTINRCCVHYRVIGQVYLVRFELKDKYFIYFNYRLLQSITVVLGNID